MATIKDPILGNLSGRLGDYVFRQRYGKTIVYYMPRKQKKFESEEETKKTNESIFRRFIKRNKHKND
jgi:hypothetical protein